MRKKPDWPQVAFGALIAAIVLAGLAFFAFVVYCYIAYGGLPASEVPAWVWWMMRR